MLVVILGSEDAIISVQAKALTHGAYSHFKNKKYIFRHKSRFKNTNWEMLIERQIFHDSQMILL